MGGVIVVGAGRSQPICLWMWCLYTPHHCRENCTTICFSINCPTVICVPTICYFYERCHWRTLRPPGLFTYIFTNAFSTLFPFILFYFILQFTIIYTPHLLANKEIKGIDNR